VKVLFVHVPWLATASGGGIGWSSLSPGEACRLGRFLPNCAEVPGELGDLYADAAAVSEAVATAGEPVPGQRAHAAKATRTVEIACGHHPFLFQPEALVQIIADTTR
jgi:hypothetical protein